MSQMYRASGPVTQEAMSVHRPPEELTAVSTATVSLEAHSGPSIGNGTFNSSRAKLSEYCYACCKYKRMYDVIRRVGPVTAASNPTRLGL